MSFNFNLRSFIRAFYLPTVCCVCGQTAAQVALKACAGCKLITYCSPSHQKEHWTDHKSFCQAARAVSKVMKVSCLFQNSYESVTLFKLYRDVILLALVKQLGRPLEMFEQEMVYYPNCCMVCHRYEKSMITCNTCSYVWYCSEEHKTSDSEAHSKLCKHLSNLVKFHLGYIVMREKNICEGYCVTNLDDKFPKNLESFMNVSVNLMEVSTYLGEELCEIHASDCFSFPMTAVYALKKCCKTLGRNLVIHVVGAQDMEPNDLNLWKCLRIILEDNFDKVTIVLIGPELNMEFFSRSVSANTGDKFEYKASKNYYHTFYEEENIEYQPPDLIIAFNCGFHAGKSSGEPDSWKDTIPYFCKHPNALIVFTSYSKKEAEDDLEYFIANCGGKELEMLVKHERNPFRSLKPCYVLWESREDALFFANDHITILKPK